jgi:D-glycero-alpha-D-manno-heptose-7-phosphate kinase
VHDPRSRRSLIATAPTRLDFGGGWTDVPPFPEERGGFVCNLAIERRASVVLRERFAAIDGGALATTHTPLVQAAMRKAERSLGAPLQWDVSLTSDFPVGAGLGGSSAAMVALAAALAEVQRRTFKPEALAEWSRAVEVDEMGVPGGRQDHYAAAFGGALALTFGHDTAVQRVPLSDETVSDLEARCLVVYTGESRISGSTISAVLDAYNDRHSPVVRALESMKSLAMRMPQALTSGRIDDLAALVDEHWQHQRSLHPGITTARIDALEIAARGAGAIAIKALGASGGGCVAVFAPRGDDGRVAAAIAPWGEPVAWRVSHDGVHVHEVMETQ